MRSDLPVFAREDERRSVGKPARPARLRFERAEGGRGTALVVEDRSDLMERYLAALSLRGYTASGVGTLKAALQALATGSTPRAFDVIVSELVLPDGSALKLIERALRLEPAPVAAIVSAHLDASAALTLARLGVFYFPKPFAEVELDQLMTLVEHRRFGIAGDFARAHGLSPRETEAVRLSLERCSLRKAAAVMGISTSTLKEYWIRIFEKTGLRSQADVVRSVVSESQRNKRRL